jgi:SDR family mycofactocin-dependent oxidoreductase
VGTRLEGKTALVTGAARGQGRAHAKRLAEEGADIVALDICGDLAGVGYPMATEDDLAETVALVEATGQRILARQADVRDQAALDGVVAEAVGELGHIDIVVANAGVVATGMLADQTESEWDVVVDVMLKGTWQTIKAAVPSMIDAGRGGSIVLISSVAGLKGIPGCGAYPAAKFGMVGLAQSLAAEVGAHSIRVNTINPTNVDTDMLQNEMVRGVFGAAMGRLPTDLPTDEEFATACLQQHLLPISWVESIDVSNAVLWLASDEARYVTGVSLPIDGGALIK